MLKSIERMVLAESHDRHDAGHHVEQEGSEVAHQGYDQKALRDLGRSRIMENSDAVPNVLRQPFDGTVLLCGRPAEIEQNRGNTDHRRNRGQSPDGTVRRQPLAVQHAKVIGHLFVAAHGVGYACAGAEAR